jgi:cholest-4-en-3-one 26-monooxygenase
MTLDHIDLNDPDNFVNGTPHHWFKELRASDPVHWHAEKNGPGFWCITKYEDVKTISRNPLLFSSWLGGTNIEDRDEASLTGMRMIMLNMDPPQHVKFRRIVQRGFTPQMTAKQEPYLRALARRIVDAVAHRGECEFVEELAAELPLQVICELVGVPQEDRKLIFELSNKLIGFDDPEFQNTEEDARNASAQIFGLGMKLAERYKKDPQDNLTTALILHEIDGEKLSELEFCSFFLLLLVAGSETTRTVTTSGMKALLDHPRPAAALAANPTLVPQAVEEFVRFDPACTTSGAPPPRHGAARAQDREGDKRGDDVRVGEPRRGRVRGPRSLRHRPREERTPRVRDRRALLPGREPRAARAGRHLPGDVEAPEEPAAGRSAAPAALELRERREGNAHRVRSRTRLNRGAQRCGQSARLRSNAVVEQRSGSGRAGSRRSRSARGAESRTTCRAA